MLPESLYVILLSLIINEQCSSHKLMWRNGIGWTETQDNENNSF